MKDNLREDSSNINLKSQVSADRFVELVLQAFGADKIQKQSDFHGSKDKNLIFVCPIDSGVSETLVSELLEKCSQEGYKHLVLLSFLYENGILPGIIKTAKLKGIQLDTRTIPPQILNGDIQKISFPNAYKDPFSKTKKWFKRIILILLVFYGPFAVPCCLTPYLNCSYGGIYHWHWVYCHDEVLEIDGAKFLGSSQTIFGGLRPVGEPFSHGGFYYRNGNSYYLIPWNLMSWTISLNRAPLKLKRIFWGERYYIVPDYALENLKYALEQKWEPRHEGYGFDAIFLRQGDQLKFATGTPTILP